MKLSDLAPDSMVWLPASLVRDVLTLRAIFKELASDDQAPFSVIWICLLKVVTLVPIGHSHGTDGLCVSFTETPTGRTSDAQIYCTVEEHFDEQ